MRVQKSAGSSLLTEDTKALYLCPCHSVARWIRVVHGCGHLCVPSNCQISPGPQRAGLGRLRQLCHLPRTADMSLRRLG